MLKIDLMGNWGVATELAKYKLLSHWLLRRRQSQVVTGIQVEEIKIPILVDEHHDKMNNDHYNLPLNTQRSDEPPSRCHYCQLHSG